MNWGKRDVGLVVVVIALAVATISPAVVGGSGIGGSVTNPSVNDEGTESYSSQNDTTVRHRNPSEVRKEEKPSELQLWLASETAGRHSESVNVSQSDRERARKLIENNPRYEDLAIQYAEVAIETGNDSEKQASDRFLVVGELQQKFFADVHRYRQTLRKYRQARDRNATLQTRRLAHELDRHAAEVNRTAVRFNDSYANLSSEEQAKIANSTRDIGQIRANVIETQSTVRNRTLVSTSLTVWTVGSNGSFTDPVQLVGRLETDNGTAVSNQNVTLRINNQTLQTRTDFRGEFEAEYRPTLLSVGEHHSSVRFQPANTSVYTSANATIGFTVQQATPNVTISNRTAEVGYNETLVINGTLEADGVGASRVPLTVTVDGIPVGRTKTGANGSFGLAARVPANVSDGSQRVRVRVSLSDRALGSADASTRVRVESTQTSVLISDTRVFDETAFISGRLTTGDGVPLANQTIQLRINGTIVGSTTTNETGGYATIVAVPPGLRNSDSTVHVVVAYSSEGNLESARSDAALTFSSGDTEFFSGRAQRGIAGALGVAVLGTFVWRLFASDESLESSEKEGDESRSTSDITDTSGSPHDALLDSATAFLANEQFDAAVVTAYAAVRRRLSDDGDSGTHLTHWELFADCRDGDLSDEQLGRLKRLTETFERAAFAAESVPEDDAAEAVSIEKSLGREGEGDESSKEDAADFSPT